MEGQNTECELENIYDNLYEFDLGTEIAKFAEENKKLKEDIEKLQQYVSDFENQLAIVTKARDRCESVMSSLYLTAKTEMDRKDRTIAELQRKLDDTVFRRYNRQNVAVQPSEERENKFNKNNQEVPAKRRADFEQSLYTKRRKTSPCEDDKRGNNYSRHEENKRCTTDHSYRRGGEDRNSSLESTNKSDNHLRCSKDEFSHRNKWEQKTSRNYHESRSRESGSSSRYHRSRSRDRSKSNHNQSDVHTRSSQRESREKDINTHPKLSPSSIEKSDIKLNKCSKTNDLNIASKLDIIDSTGNTNIDNKSSEPKENVLNESRNDTKESELPKNTPEVVKEKQCNKILERILPESTDKQEHINVILKEEQPPKCYKKLKGKKSPPTIQQKERSKAIPNENKVVESPEENKKSKRISNNTFTKNSRKHKLSKQKNIINILHTHKQTSKCDNELNATDFATTGEQKTKEKVEQQQCKSAQDENTRKYLEKQNILDSTHNNTENAKSVAENHKLNVTRSYHEEHKAKFSEKQPTKDAINPSKKNWIQNKNEESQTLNILVENKDDKTFDVCKSVQDETMQPDNSKMLNSTHNTAENFKCIPENCKKENTKLNETKSSNKEGNFSEKHHENTKNGNTTNTDEKLFINPSKNRNNQTLTDQDKDESSKPTKLNLNKKLTSNKTDIQSSLHLTNEMEQLQCKTVLNEKKVDKHPDSTHKNNENLGESVSEDNKEQNLKLNERKSSKIQQRTKSSEKQHQSTKNKKGIDAKETKFSENKNEEKQTSNNLVEEKSNNHTSTTKLTFNTCNNIEKKETKDKTDIHLTNEVKQQQCKSVEEENTGNKITVQNDENLKSVSENIKENNSKLIDTKSIKKETKAICSKKESTKNENRINPNEKKSIQNKNEENQPSKNPVEIKDENLKSTKVNPNTYNSKSVSENHKDENPKLNETKSYYEENKATFSEKHHQSTKYGNIINPNEKKLIQNKKEENQTLTNLVENKDNKTLHLTNKIERQQSKSVQDENRQNIFSVDENPGIISKEKAKIFDSIHKNVSENNKKQISKLKPSKREHKAKLSQNHHESTKNKDKNNTSEKKLPENKHEESKEPTNHVEDKNETSKATQLDYNVYNTMGQEISSDKTVIQSSHHLTNREVEPQQCKNIQDKNRQNKNTVDESDNSKICDSVHKNVENLKRASENIIEKDLKLNETKSLKRESKAENELRSTKNENSINPNEKNSIQNKNKSKQTSTKFVENKDENFIFKDIQSSHHLTNEVEKQQCKIAQDENRQNKNKIDEEPKEKSKIFTSTCENDTVKLSENCHQNCTKHDNSINPQTSTNLAEDKNQNSKPTKLNIPTYNNIEKKITSDKTDIQSSLHLTNEGDIPVLHFEDISFSNASIDGIIVDKNIFNLMDAMNFTGSNLDMDLAKFKNCDENESKQKSDVNQSEDNTCSSLTFSNCLDNLQNKTFPEVNEGNEHNYQGKNCSIDETKINCNKKYETIGTTTNGTKIVSKFTPLRRKRRRPVMTEVD